MKAADIAISVYRGIPMSTFATAVESAMMEILMFVRNVLRAEPFVSTNLTS
jgi:hypothetical protein